MSDREITITHAILPGIPGVVELNPPIRWPSKNCPPEPPDLWRQEYSADIDPPPDSEA